jgi:hypothetical protein
MATKNYYYFDLQFPIANETEAKFSVKYITDANFGKTKITVPQRDEPFTIDNAGTINIGNGSDLRNATIAVSCKVSNPAPQEDTIIVGFFINDKLISLELENNEIQQEYPDRNGYHINKKSAGERIRIMLAIKFPSI